MKAITVYQPWASLLAILAKLYETRSWATSYRGPIAIHAGKKEMMYELPKYVQAAIANALINAETESLCLYPADNLPRGAVIATAELVGCWRITANDGKRASLLHLPNGNPCVFGNELLFGDWTPGRYAWEFANMKMLDESIPAKGHQRLWEWEGVA